MEKNFISLNFYIYFPQTTYFFYFFNSPLPLLAGSILQNIHPCFIVKLGWWLISIEPKKLGKMVSLMGSKDFLTNNLNLHGFFCSP